MRPVAVYVPSSPLGGGASATASGDRVVRRLSAIESELTVLKGVVDDSAARVGDLAVEQAEDTTAVMRLANLAQAEVAANGAWREAEWHRMQTEYRHQVGGYVSATTTPGTLSPPGPGGYDLQGERMRLESSRLRFEAELGLLGEESMRNKAADELERERIRAMLSPAGAAAEEQLWTASKDAERAKHAVERERRLLEEERGLLDAELETLEVRKEKAARRLRSSRLWAGYNSWRTRVLAERRRRWCMGQAVGHLRHRAVARAWNSWRGRTVERKECLERLDLQKVLCGVTGENSQIRVWAV